MATEIEVRFLEVDVAALRTALSRLGADELGEVLLKEIIFLDAAGQWSGQGKLVRVRSDGEKCELAYKHHHAHTIDGAREIEVEVASFEKTAEFLRAVGLKKARIQEKKR